MQGRFYGYACTVYPKKYAYGFCFAVLCCGYTLTDFPISIRITSLALWQSNDCPSASKATLMNMDKYFMWIHYERLHNHTKAKHNKTVCIFLGIYCSCVSKTITRDVKTVCIFLGIYCRLPSSNFLTTTIRNIIWNGNTSSFTVFHEIMRCIHKIVRDLQ